jgi:hypothetical protein
MLLERCRDAEDHHNEAGRDIGTAASREPPLLPADPRVYTVHAGLGQGHASSNVQALGARGAPKELACAPGVTAARPFDPPLSSIGALFLASSRGTQLRSPWPGSSDVL